jgi:sugar lactone lactonase YvrE
MQSFDTEVLIRPETAEQRFLPEGPYPVGNGVISWVSIQHGSASTTGSLNLLDLSTGQNRNVPLAGRPGFAFPTDRPDVFVVGLEHRVALVDVNTGEETILADDVDADVAGTIINDGVAFSGGLIFGCKDLKFAEKKAGLFLLRSSDQALIRLRNDQVCSNGKIVVGRGNQVTLLDIDTPTKQVVRYTLDVAAGTLSEAEVVVDLTDGQVFPDGMVATPDGLGVIIAFYDPRDSAHGEARQYSLETGELQAIWKTDRSPRVTCPLLIKIDGAVKLILTTADEGMSREQQAQHLNAGCLFVGGTEFTSVPESPVFEVLQ